jgi:hypothetical protein
MGRTVARFVAVGLLARLRAFRKGGYTFLFIRRRCGKPRPSRCSATARPMS